MALFSLCVHGAGAYHLSASVVAHHGILPPANPGHSLAPRPDFLASPSCRGASDTTACNALVDEAVTYARKSLENLGPFGFKLSAYEKLDKVEQLFVATDLERVSRGLAPVTELSHGLNVIAQAGAAADQDPNLGGILGKKLAGGGTVVAAGGNWASGFENPLGSDYGWMYDDGPGGSDGECNQKHLDCWGHRDNILGTYATASRCHSSTFETVMGAGYLSKGGSDGDSETQLFAGVCGKAPTDTVLTWTKAKSLLGIG